MAAMFLSGCAGGPISVPQSAPTGVSKGPKFKGPDSDAGVKATQDTDATVFKKMVQARAASFHPRGDAFALTADEKSYDYSQSAERVFSEIGGFPTYVQPSEPVAPQVVTEQQPYRRLSGVVVGDSVLAIIDMGNGAAPVLIRPGMHIPNTEWTVVSIDLDKAVLHRSGNVLPNTIEVRLETPPANYASGTGGAPGGYPGAGYPGGGYPGGGYPGGGYPGAGGPRGPGGPGGGGAGD
jgi:hypothetical protein